MRLTLRREAIVAMEQLAAPQGLPELMKQVRKEKDQQVTGSLWRAIGACGAKDAKARAALLKATKGKDALARRSALLGLGWSEPNEDVQECLAAMLAGTDEVERAAAAVAMGPPRATRVGSLCSSRWWRARARRSCGPAAPQPLEVLRGASYERLGPSLKRIADDDIPRARLFGGGP
ncbi:MAG: HEAT repeat domain-containing protein [Planctomycetota bacterium]